MQVMYESCAGIDVHAKTVVVCLLKETGRVIRTFSTMTDDLLNLLDWLVAERCSHVAIESTGVYWRPVFNILECLVKVILVNAQHIKNVPGRKTDVRDCEWIAELLQHGLLKASFIPPMEIRELRELTRYRKCLTRERTRIANRIHKVVESGNIKLGQVATDALGVSGRAMLHALAAGETDVEKMAEMSHKRLRDKRPELRRALDGRLTTNQRWILGELLSRYDEIETAVTHVHERIRQYITECSDPFIREACAMIDVVPGIGQELAEDIIAETGVDMASFPSDRHIASWAGVCPGNRESAGKRKRERIGKGNPYLRSALTQAAWAASRTRKSYLSSQYHRLAKRLGGKRALVAVSHSILVIIYHMLSKKTPYHDLGPDFVDERSQRILQKRLIHKLETLGLKVSIEERPRAA